MNSKNTLYHYNNGILLSEQTRDEILGYYYDSMGKVPSLSYQKGNGAETGYFFARNGQGDMFQTISTDMAVWEVAGHPD